MKAIWNWLKKLFGIKEKETKSLSPVVKRATVRKASVRTTAVAKPAVSKSTTKTTSTKKDVKVKKPIKRTVVRKK